MSLMMMIRSRWIVDGGSLAIGIVMFAGSAEGHACISML